MDKAEAVKIVRNIYQTDKEKEALETLIPELKENEDERIRKMLIEIVNITPAALAIENRSELLAYLEKQKPAEKQDYSGLTDIEGAIHRGFLSAGVENVPVTIIKETAQDCLTHIDKSAEWNEKDEKMIERLIRHTQKEYDELCNDRYGHQEIISDLKESCRERMNWLENRLKSLRPPQDRCKDCPHRSDMFLLTQGIKSGKHDLAIKFMNYLDENRPEGKMGLSNGECEDIDKAFEENDWNKIIRYIEKYKPHWKPSEEHFQGLRRAITKAENGSDAWNSLKDLYEHLQKLR